MVGWEGSGTRVLGDGGGHIGSREPCGCYRFCFPFSNPLKHGADAESLRDALSWEREWSVLVDRPRFW